MESTSSKFRPLMVMGTSSGAGKSLIVTALCRIFNDMGIKVAPFKVQNMSLNAGVGKGGEMAYAQIIQARAARIQPTVDMNPILLKPEGGKTHIVLQGKYYGTYEAGKYFTQDNDFFLRKALESFKKIQKDNDLVIIEGAGSPAEINIKNDIANTKFSSLVNAQNILVADIERGGVFASIVGTIELSNIENLIGIIINKFRGETSLLKEGYDFIEKKFNVPVIGTVPFISNNIPQEDSMFDNFGRRGDINIGIIRTPYMSNETDYEVLKMEKSIGLIYTRKPEELDKVDIIIIPGSKITVRDLIFIEKEGFKDKINQLKTEVWVAGFCGGFQMIGKYIMDIDETGSGKVYGLNLLDSRTLIKGEKVTRMSSATILHPMFKGMKVEGYEIHRGISYSHRHFSFINMTDGEPSHIPDGSYKDKIFGTYIHGIFDNVNFTESIVNTIRREKGLDAISLGKIDPDYEIQNFADSVKKSIDYKFILESLI